MTGQYGKNHLGDLDEHLPTHHGFDEFFGNLYHLNAEEEPENPDYPKAPTFKEKFGPRGVIKSLANPDGTQTIEDTGPLTKERMQTIDDEITKGALDFIDRAHAAGKPFFLWWNSTRMHIWTHLKPASQGVTGIGIYPDGMVEHDEEGIGYDAWRIERAFALMPAQAFVAQWLQSFKDFPPRQKAATFGIDQVMDQLTTGGTSSN